MHVGNTHRVAQQHVDMKRQEESRLRFDMCQEVPLVQNDTFGETLPASPSWVVPLKMPSDAKARDTYAPYVTKQGVERSQRCCTHQWRESWCILTKMRCLLHGKRPSWRRVREFRAPALCQWDT